MMKILGKTAAGLVLLLVVLVFGAFAAVNFVSWNAYKGMIADQARDATGRELVIEGDLDGGVSMAGVLQVKANGVRFSNAPGAADPNMAKLASLELRMQLMPLLFGKHVVVDSIIVNEPVISLEVDANGRPNWVFKDTSPPEDDSGNGKLPVAGVRISELLISNGAYSYSNHVSGQKVEGSKINFKLALSKLDEPLNADGSMVLNKEKVSLKLSVDTPMALINGTKATTSLALDSRHINIAYAGSIQSKPVAGLDGEFSLDVTSVGRLLAWLDRPLAKGQPDPGPLKLKASFSGDGAKVALKQATIEGQSLQAKASGSFDGSGPVKRVSLQVEGGVLDVDRYLPAPAPGKPGVAAKRGDGKTANPLQALSDQPFDLSGLKGAEADVKVAIKGIKVSGFNVGPIDFTANLKGGVMNADLTQLALYGGGVTGKVNLDGSGSALGLDTTLAVDKVKVDQLAKAATGEASMVGIASGDLAIQSLGSSPRELVQNLKGKFAFTLGNVKNAPGGAITEAALSLDLPGLKAQPKFLGSVVYNRQKVVFAATIDPLQTALEKSRFNADLKVTSTPLSLSYVGAVQYRPAPGLDGKVNLDVASVAKLAAWLGQPLAKGQPDPGPLKVVATMSSKGETTTLKEATVVGKAMQAKASGSFIASKPVARFDAKVDVVQADLAAYLPPEEKNKSAKAAAPAAGSSGWSSDPYDFSGLKTANGQAVVTLAQVTYKGLTIDKGRVMLTVKDGVLETKVEDIALAGGSINARAVVDASGNIPKLSYKTGVKGAQARPLLTAFAGNDRVSGTANLEAEGAAQGISQRDMVASLNGKGSLQFLNGAIHGVNIAATLRKAQSLSMGSSASEAQTTDFAELGGTFVIKNGVIDNRDFKLLAPLLRVGGAGLVPMPPRTVDYAVEAKLVGSLKGQGSKDALAGIPIPIKVTGSWDQPKYIIDWDGVLKAIASDPARLANLPGNLSAKAKALGLALPGSGGKTGDILKGITDSTATSPASRAVDRLKGITGGATNPPASSDNKTDTTAQPAQKKEEPALKPRDLLKGLFK
jgi:AsmA protein